MRYEWEWEAWRCYVMAGWSDKHCDTTTHQWSGYGDGFWSAFEGHRADCWSGRDMHVRLLLPPPCSYQEGYFSISWLIFEVEFVKIFCHLMLLLLLKSNYLLFQDTFIHHWYTCIRIWTANCSFIHIWKYIFILLLMFTA